MHEAKDSHNEIHKRGHEQACGHEAADIAAKANPKEMWLTHYSPSLIRPEEFMQEVREIFPASIAAKDGRSCAIAFEEE